MSPFTHVYHLNAAQLFTVFFVMMGPLRLLGPFAKIGLTLDSSTRWKVSILAPLITLISLVAIGFFGSGLLDKWQVPNIVLMLAAGIIFFLTSIKALITPGKEKESSLEGKIKPGDIALNLIMTSYGIATVIVLMSASQGPERTRTIILSLTAVMGLNVLSMSLGHYVLKVIGFMPLKIFGAAMGSLQLALALHIIIVAIRNI